MTLTRADALAVGGLLALLLRLGDGERRVRKFSPYVGAVAIVLIVVLSRGFDPIHHPWQRTALYSALAIFFAALVHWAIDAASLCGIPHRFYGNAALRAIGGYSYGIYILHLPLTYLCTAAFARARLYDPNHPTWTSGAGVTTACLALTAIASFISFQFVERPLLKLKRFFPERETEPGSSENICQSTYRKSVEPNSA
jgi:peptidoglycan/LPS O-acetylase OafA/YrhL